MFKAEYQLLHVGPVERNKICTGTGSAVICWRSETLFCKCKISKTVLENVFLLFTYFYLENQTHGLAEHLTACNSQTQVTTPPLSAALVLCHKNELPFFPLLFTIVILLELGFPEVTSGLLHKMKTK